MWHFSIMQKTFINWKRSQKDISSFLTRRGEWASLFWTWRRRKRSCCIEICSSKAGMREENKSFPCRLLPRNGCPFAIFLIDQGDLFRQLLFMKAFLNSNDIISSCVDYMKDPNEEASIPIPSKPIFPTDSLNGVFSSETSPSFPTIPKKKKPRLWLSFFNGLLLMKSIWWNIF